MAAVTGACMLILLAWSVGIPTQINPPVPAVYPSCGECRDAGEEWQRAVPPDQIAGVKTTRYTPACVPAPATPEPAPPIDTKKEPEPPQQRRGR